MSNSIRYNTMACSSISETVASEWQAPPTALVHWDGKKMDTLDGGGKEERLPVVLSGGGNTKLLGTPALPPKDPDTPMGSIIADAVVGVLEEWGVDQNVVGMGFDTTSVNTGKGNGI